MATGTAGISRQKATLKAMVRIYCRSHHPDHDRKLCPQCLELEQYAIQRLNKCPFGPTKGLCAKCEIHCYRPDMRRRIREVMRYSGPKILARHPLLAIFHLIDGWTGKFERSK